MSFLKSTLPSYHPYAAGWDVTHLQRREDPLGLDLSWTVISPTKEDRGGSYWNQTSLQTGTCGNNPEGVMKKPKTSRTYRGAGSTMNVWQGESPTYGFKDMLMPNTDLTHQEWQFFQQVSKTASTRLKLLIRYRVIRSLLGKTSGGTRGQ